MQAGDFILVEGDHFASKVIRFGQRIRFSGKKRPYAKWNHAALILNSSGDLAEALTTGLSKTHISKYPAGTYALINVGASPEDQKEILTFAEAVLAARQKYAFVTIFGMMFTMLLGSKFVIGRVGTAICSGFVSEALVRKGEVFNRPPSYMSPADLAEHFNIT